MIGNGLENPSENNERIRKKNAAINRKIARLKSARADLNTVREEWAGLKLETLEKNGEGLWSGSCNQNEYLDALEKAKKKVDQVTTDCEILDDIIAREINLLYAQQGTPQIMS